jgi:hypothetical protein
MSSTASPLLQIEEQAAGENNNAWGTKANASMQRLEDAIARVTAVALSADYTLSDTQYSQNESRSMILSVTGAGGFNIVIPNRSKVYLVKNGSSGTASIKTATGTGLSVASGDTEWVWCDGSNVVSRLKIPTAAIDATFGTVAALDIATSAQFQANTASKALTTDKVWTAAAAVALTDAATIALDLSTGFNFSVMLAGNRTLGNPTNPKVGQSGVIQITQDATGSRTLAYSSNWKFANGQAPTLSLTAAATDILFYQVISSTFIYATLVKDVK